MLMDELAREHIQGFINSFIDGRRKSGWQSALLDRPSKAYKHLVKFERHNNPSRCKEIQNPEKLLESLGSEKCLYWYGFEEPVFTTALEVAGIWLKNQQDAIVSFVPGKRAVFLFHEGWGWQCDI